MPLELHLLKMLFSGTIKFQIKCLIKRSPRRPPSVKIDQPFWGAGYESSSKRDLQEFQEFHRFLFSYCNEFKQKICVFFCHPKNSNGYRIS